MYSKHIMDVWMDIQMYKCTYGHMDRLTNILTDIQMNMQTDG